MGPVVHRLDATQILSDKQAKPDKTHTILQTDTSHDQMVILYYELHSFRIIDVPGCKDKLPTSQSELALPSRPTGSWLPGI